ncbi:unnamed protein product [Vitrella brassicaformis CCMP3155]|uniref:CCR4-NOT transcription complex subunit 1 CAF1-binding domain-containing protein n=1 Tax=Vitrella brassicaformis (strain CCMP3155) TaxID=1169540 RepID=A0A0G4GYH3_VITBC|nr:unnamed protein product [Vitrella brassicaformis CCMP3155]|eukprot:CEM36038.1 unnamed protein product [Vitrella brassicaformis CCMP3155]
MANLGDLLGKLLALVDHHAAAPFTSRLPGMLETACRDGHLLTLLPVVCGILRQLSASGVEGDGDVQTALSMLKDIGDLPNIRLQLQFNVVRLFKELQLDIDSLQTTGRVSTTAMAASEVQEQS